MSSTKEKPSYYAILTADVRYSEKLSSSQKLFFAEVTALTQKNGRCWASNKYFSDLFGVARSTISNWVKALESEGFIEVSYKRDGKEIKERVIKITASKRFVGGQKTEQGGQETEEGCSENPNRGCSKNLKENNTSKSNTTRGNKSAREDSENEENPPGIVDRVKSTNSIEELYDIYKEYRGQKGRFPTLFEEDASKHKLKEWGLEKSKLIVIEAIRNGWMSLKKDYLPDETESDFQSEGLANAGAYTEYQG